MSDKGEDLALKFQDYLEYAAFILIAGLLRIMPLSLAVWLGRVLAWLFCRFSSRSTEFIKLQMRECFGDRYTEKEYKRLVSKFYTHFGCLFAECVRLDKINQSNIDKIVDWGDFVDVVDDLIETSNKGVFFATGHIGNWEFTGSACCVKGFLAGAIARPLDNPLLERLIKGVRESSGLKIWNKDGAIVKLLKAIKHKKSVGVLIDQDGGEQGLQVPFLGRNSSTNTAIAEMSIRKGIPILPSAIVRVQGKPMQFKIVYGQPIIPQSSDTSQSEVFKIMNQVNLELSRIISENPEQWLWIHKRWKTPNPSDTRRYKRYE